MNVHVLLEWQPDSELLDQNLFLRTILIGFGNFPVHQPTTKLLSFFFFSAPARIFFLAMSLCAPLHCFFLFLLFHLKFLTFSHASYFEQEDTISWRSP